MHDETTIVFRNMTAEQQARWQGYTAEVAQGIRPRMTMAFMLDVQCDKDIAPKTGTVAWPRMNQYDDDDNLVVEDNETTALVDIDDPRGNELHGLTEQITGLDVTFRKVRESERAKVETVPVEPDEHDLLQSTVMKYMAIVGSHPRVYLFQRKSRYSGLEITIKIPNLKD